MPNFNDLYNAPLIQKASISGLIEAPMTKEYPLDVVLQDCTLHSLSVKAASGSAVVQVLVNDVEVSEFNNVTVTNTLVIHTLNAAVDLSPGDVLALVCVSGDATDLFFNIEYNDLVVGAA